MNAHIVHRELVPTKEPPAIYTLVDTLYLPSVVGSRSVLAERGETLVDQLHTSRDALGFLLTFLALRIGPLAPIPGWLRTSAQLCEATHPTIAEHLRETAELEQLHRQVLIEDLVGVRERFGAVDLYELTQQPFDARVEHHARLRELVPTRSVPLIVLAIDLELAEFGRVFGPMLLGACQHLLGADAHDCLRFIDLRCQNTEGRIHARLAQLEAVVAQQPRHGRAWAKVASDVTRSYVDALFACLDHARELSEPPRPQPNFTLEMDTARA